MRAVVLQRLGGPDVLGVTEWPQPEPEPGEVLIRVALAGINPADAQQRETGRNHLGPAVPAPFVLGGEVVGARQDTGERVAAVCGIGGYAEWAIAPEDRCVPVPDGLTDAVALSLLVQGLTAWHLLRTPVALAAGATVVVHGAGGGVGMLAVQLARILGAGTVVATARSTEAREQALALGADAALAEDDADLTGALLEATGGGADLALDMVGGRVFEASLAALAPFGRLIVYGAASGASGTVAARGLIPGSRSVAGLWLVDCLRDPQRLRADYAALAELALAGELQTTGARAFGLGESSAAHEALAARTARVKLVLDPAR